MPEGMVSVAGGHIFSQINKIARYSSNLQSRVYIWGSWIYWNSQI